MAKSVWALSWLIAVSAYAQGEVDSDTKIAIWGDNSSQICSGYYSYKRFNLCDPTEVIAENQSPTLTGEGCQVRSTALVIDPSCPKTTETYTCAQPTGEVAIHEYTVEKKCEKDCAPNHISCDVNAEKSKFQAGTAIHFLAGASKEKEECRVKQAFGSNCMIGQRYTVCAYRAEIPATREATCTRSVPTACKKSVTYNSCRSSQCGVESKTLYSIKSGLTLSEFAWSTNRVYADSIVCTTCEGMPIGNKMQIDAKLLCLSNAIESKIYRSRENVRNSVDAQLGALTLISDSGKVEMSEEAIQWLRRMQAGAGR